MENEHLPNFDKLRQQFAGSRYSELVEEHMRKTGKGIEVTVLAYMGALSKAEQQVAMELIDECNWQARIYGFLQKDCREAFDAICDRFAVMMKEKRQSVDDSAKFTVFQIVTLNFACMARDDKRFRRHAGIPEKRSCVSKVLLWILMFGLCSIFFVSLGEDILKYILIFLTVGLIAHFGLFTLREK